MLKTTKYVSIIVLSVLIVSCDNNIGGIQNNNKNTIDLQTVLNNAVNSQDAKNAHITGIPLTFQCNGINKNLPLLLSSGKISDQVDAPDLPTDAIYQIGSSTKSFTAVVVLQLEAEGYFGTKGLNNTVGEVLGNPVGSATWNESWNQIPMRQLLNMTSGIPDYFDDAFTIYSEYPYRQFSTDDLIGLVVNKKPDFQPGQGWNYSNTNYAIMNKIISHVTNSNIKQQITTRIFNVLGFTHTYYVDNIPTQEINPSQQILLMSGYFFGSKDIAKPIHDGVDIKPYSLSFGNAAGSILSDTAEVTTYVKALFTEKAQGGLLEPKQLAELKDFVATENTDKYKAGEHITVVDKATKTGLGLGYGLGIMEYFVQLPDGSNFNYYSHGGDTAGFDSNWIYQENKQAYVSYVFNSRGTGLGNVRRSIESEILAKISNECLKN